MKNLLGSYPLINIVKSQYDPPKICTCIIRHKNTSKSDNCKISGMKFTPV
jgi:hypothetical protein